MRSAAKKIKSTETKEILVLMLIAPPLFLTLQVPGVMANVVVGWCDGDEIDDDVEPRAWSNLLAIAIATSAAPAVIRS